MIREYNTNGVVHENRKSLAPSEHLTLFRYISLYAFLTQEIAQGTYRIAESCIMIIMKIQQRLRKGSCLLWLKR
jgi:hypothetical protein